MKNLRNATKQTLAIGAVFAVSALISAQNADAQPRWGRPSQPSAGACFYRDADFRGEYFCANAGEDVAALSQSMRGQISSIRVFGDTEISAFERDRFAGRSAVFEGDVRNLRFEGWNDRFASFRLRSQYTDGRRDNRGWTDSRRPGDDYDRGRPGYSDDRNNNARPGDDRRDGGGLNPNDRSDRNDRGRASDADGSVRRLYQELLQREPDAAGLKLYTDHMVRDNWSESAVRDAIVKSPEYRQKSVMTQQKAQEIVARAYRATLNREPDPASQVYVDKVMRERWTESDVTRELRNSPEYKSKQRR